MTKDFPPQKVQAIVAEVAALLKEKKETVSVAETVCAFLSPSLDTRDNQFAAACLMSFKRIGLVHPLANCEA